MQNNSTYNYNSLDIVKYYISEFFGEDNISSSKLAFIAQVGLSLIGNKYQKLFKYTTTAISTGDEVVIPVPCNLEAIEAITLNNRDEYSAYNRFDIDKSASYMSLYLPFISQVSNQQESNIHVDFVSGKDTKEYFLKGTLLNFSFTGDRIVIDSKYEGSSINVMYRGTISDSDGIPMVTNREAIALAFYWNYTNELKKLVTRKGGDGGLLQFATQLKDDWIRKARVPELLSQNELSAIKDAVKRRSFPGYGKSTKFGI